MARTTSSHVAFEALKVVLQHWMTPSSSLLFLESERQFQGLLGSLNTIIIPQLQPQSQQENPTTVGGYHKQDISGITGCNEGRVDPNALTQANAVRAAFREFDIHEHKVNGVVLDLLPEDEQLITTQEWKNRLIKLIEEVCTHHYVPYLTLQQIDACQQIIKLKTTYENLTQDIISWIHVQSKRCGHVSCIIVYQLYFWLYWEQHYKTICELVLSNLMMYPLLLHYRINTLVSRVLPDEVKNATFDENGNEFVTTRLVRSKLTIMTLNSCKRVLLDWMCHRCQTTVGNPKFTTLIHSLNDKWSEGLLHFRHAMLHVNVDCAININLWNSNDILVKYRNLLLVILELTEYPPIETRDVIIKDLIMFNHPEVKISNHRKDWTYDLKCILQQAVEFLRQLFKKNS